MLSEIIQTKMNIRGYHVYVDISYAKLRNKE